MISRGADEFFLILRGYDLMHKEGPDTVSDPSFSVLYFFNPGQDLSEQCLRAVQNGCYRSAVDGV